MPPIHMCAFLNHENECRISWEYRNKKIIPETLFCAVKKQPEAIEHKKTPHLNESNFKFLFKYFLLLSAFSSIAGLYFIVRGLREIDRYPGIAPQPIQHNKFIFTAPVIPTMKQEKISLAYLEKLIQENPGKSSIHDHDKGLDIVVHGVKNGEWINGRGCFEGDDECSVIGLLKQRH